MNGDRNWISDARMIENVHVKQNDDARQLTAKRRGVREHQTVVNPTDVHRYLLMLLSELLNVQLRHTTLWIIQTALQLLGDLLELMTEDHCQHESCRQREYVCRHEVETEKKHCNAGNEQVRYGNVSVKWS